MKVVVVESPAKAKTINKYLGSDYKVVASYGHVRDLPSKGMGVDLKTFEPSYEVLESRGKVVSELRKLAKESDQIYLATDLDREGEAIAAHLAEELGNGDAVGTSKKKKKKTGQDDERGGLQNHI